MYITSSYLFSCTDVSNCNCMSKYYIFPMLSNKKMKKIVATYEEDSQML